MSQRNRGGFTLVELLVVIAIIGVLVALLLPAIQAAREAARRNSCKNHLKQLALGCLNHQSVTGHFPTGGWGHDWIGDPDRGFGEDQPGGWIYNLLPYIEQSALHDLPSDGDPGFASARQRAGAKQMLEQPIAIINCPSRRAGVFIAGTTAEAKGNGPLNNEDSLVGRGDYAACVGDSGGYDARGPGNYEAIDDNNMLSLFDVTGNLGKRRDPNEGPDFNGVICQISMISPRHIEDGTSHTYLCGERYINANHYEGTPASSGDNETWCTGMNNDNYRTAGLQPRADSLVPIKGSTTYSDGSDIFGSAHASAMHMAFCDGHVASIDYDIDLQVHKNNGNRRDGEVGN